MKRFKFNKALLLSALLILLAACNGPEVYRISPNIITFTASPDELELGESSTLSWKVMNSEKFTVTLYPGEIELDARGSYEVTPSETTRYTLRATDKDGSSSSQIPVSVNGDEESGKIPSEPSEEPRETP